MGRSPELGVCWFPIERLGRWTSLRPGHAAQLAECGDAEVTVQTTPSFVADRKGLTFAVELRPDHGYRFSLNSATHMGLEIREGVPLDPVPVEFRTRRRN